MHQQQCAFILLFAFNQIVQGVLQGIPTSPCPKLFQYRFDGREWFGMISVKNADHSQTLHLRVTLCLVGKPSTSYLGEIEMLTREQLHSKEPILYKIKFPKSSFPPRLLQVMINGQIICMGHSAERSIFVTKIKLEHTRKYSFVPDDTSSPLASDMNQPVAPESLASLHDTDDLLPANKAFENVQLKSLPMTRFDTPILAAKDICGTVDNRIRFQVSHATKRSNSGGNSKSTINKFRISAGDNPSQRTRNSNMSEPNETDDDYNISNSGANVPLITAEFLDPLTDDVGPTQAAESSVATELPSITRGAWPWLAAIYVNNMTSLAYQCGGTLISARIVVSSAHCFKMFQKSYTANEVLVFLGRHNLKNWNEENSLAAPVDDIFLHPDFDSHLNSYDADIAVLVLKNAVRFNAFIRPACLWSGPTNIELIEGEHGIVVGWGLSNSKLNAFQTTMAYNNVVPRAIDAPIVSNDVCHKSNGQYRSLTSNRTFCAGIVASSSISTKFQFGKIKTKGKMISKSKQKQRAYKSGPCTGDSGSGLMILKNNRWMLRGIVSASIPINENNDDGQPSASEAANASKTESIDPGCNVNQYVIYTDVAKFLDWIFAFII